MRRLALPVLASASALLLSACSVVDGVAGSDGSASPTKGDDITVGLMLPDTDTARFEKFDRPIIEKRVALLTHGKGRVRYANAGAKPARQNQQFTEMIHAKVDVILVDAIDSKTIASGVEKAKDAGIPVIAYDRLAEGPIDAYVSHDNELVGEVQGRAVVEALGSKAAGSEIVMINGSPTDPNTAHFLQGALSEVKGRVVIAKSYYTKNWLPKVAGAHMKEAIQAVGLDHIAAVYAANDGLAGAAIDALKAAGVSKMPPVTGQDADLPAMRRIVSGQQRMTVYKSFLLEAGGAADMAVAKAQNKAIEFDALTPDRVNSHSRTSIPSMLVPVVAVTKDNIKSTVIKDGVYTVKDICTPEYAADCAAIGLK